MKPSLEELVLQFGILNKVEVRILWYFPRASTEWELLTPEDLPRILAEPLRGNWIDGGEDYGNYKQNLLKAVAERWLQEYARG